ncbi:MAG TPA: cob(I)yrinic acid a,c-diamide adenosyltransferase [Alloprevotella sp.]|nr:cob(I)yrinic acid a,c-diamide adenosyltransferase [Alloprevotella sp.]
MSSTTSDSRSTRLYTRRGDNGITGLADGTRVSKCDARIEACGTLDELCSHIGLLASLLPDSQCKELQEVQRRLFALSALTAGTSAPRYLPGATETAQLETLINTMTEEEGNGFGGFILPGGCEEAARAHVCRTICRRAERRMVATGTFDDDPGAAALAYINRLSDYLYALALNLNKFHKEKEIIL